MKICVVKIWGTHKKISAKLKSRNVKHLNNTLVKKYSSLAVFNFILQNFSVWVCGHRHEKFHSNFHCMMNVFIKVIIKLLSSWLWITYCEFFKWTSSIQPLTINIDKMFVLNLWLKVEKLCKTFQQYYSWNCIKLIIRKYRHY